jgi:hypothetical protein
MTTDDDDDDDLILSPAAQAALAEFLAERQAKESVEHEAPPEPQDLSIDAFPEDWQVLPKTPFRSLTLKLSQFWYDDETAETLAKELLHGATPDTVIAIISAPSVYPKIMVHLLHSTN